MPAVANIVLADAQATPVNHTFIPLGPDTEGAWWFEDQSAASPIGYNRISVKLVRPGVGAAGAVSDASRMARVKIGVHTPILENVTNSTVSGVAPAPTVSYLPRFTGEFILPERSALQNRKDLRKYVEKLMADANVTTIIEQLQNYF